ncbi:uncharacterized protein CCR75_005993 [Bremia lactucae]|uniref:Protein kinase domain-containing protein n=1 Tax=Bremia lactucae TaxID=4779 RepID=A0A976FRI6_BRELC|nr:hypothetical protein CCR75_005993 [Bremia lactucae]
MSHLRPPEAKDNSFFDSALFVLGITAASLVLLALIIWFLCWRRGRHRVNRSSNSHSQSTESMDFVLTSDLMAIVADGSCRRLLSTTSFRGKWLHHLPRIASVPSIEFFENLAMVVGRSSSGAATSTAAPISPRDTKSPLHGLEKSDSTDALAFQTLTLEQNRLPPHCVVESELLHEGTFALSFRATLTIEGQAHRQVVVRRLLPELAQQQLYRQAFAADISLSASLLHPRIVAFLGFYDPSQFVYDITSPTTPSHLIQPAAQPSAVTEFLPNGDLRTLLSLRPRNAQEFGWFHSVSVPRPKAHLALDIVDALVYLHSRSADVNTLLHPRQLKAQRVFLSEHCDAKLCAFGVRRAVGAQDMLAQSDFSVAWLAPELLRGERRSEQADVYSLGVLFTELDTCELPFAAGVEMVDGLDEQSHLAMLVSSGCIRPALSMDCPAPIQELVLRCLSFSPLQRPPAIEVQHTLRKLINGTSFCDASLTSLPSNSSSLQSTPRTASNATLSTITP